MRAAAKILMVKVAINRKILILLEEDLARVLIKKQFKSFEISLSFRGSLIEERNFSVIYLERKSRFIYFGWRN